MKIFINNNGNLSEIKNQNFSLEKEIQKITEKNLEKIFNLEFIETEFQIWNLRIDTLAFDRENNSFVIIEYKKWSSYSVIDQAMSYLALMLNNKSEFVLKIGEKRQKFISKNDIDWSQSKIIIVADSFNKYQKESINFKDLAIELYECKKFDNNIIVFNEIKARNKTESIKQITNFETKELENITREIKIYNEDDLIKKCNKNILEIYEEIKEFILDLDSEIIFEPKKYYIAFKKNWKNYFDIEILKNSLKIFLNVKIWTFEENHILRDVSNIGHYWNGDFEIKLQKYENIFDTKQFIKETYKIIENK